MVLPTIHAAGTPPEILHANLTAARKALLEAYSALQRTMPNPRDYPSHSGMALAEDEHKARIIALIGIDDGLCRLLAHVAEAKPHSCKNPLPT